MPTYDPTIRGANANLSTGGTNSVVVNLPPGVSAGDFFIVRGVVNGAIQINPPDGTWTRVGGVVTNYQVFTKLYSPGMSTTFTWDGSNQPYVFASFAVYSAGGGTIKLDSGITPNPVSSVNGSTASKTSDAITPSQNALIIVDFLEFLDRLMSGPGGLTNILNVNGSNAGTIYLPAGTTSATYTANDLFGQNHYFASGTYALVSSIVNPVSPPFIDDEAVFTPAVNRTLAMPFLDDEAVFQPSVGIGAMHTTTANAEIALKGTASNLRVTTENAEIALQHLLSATNLRATQVTAEIALQAQPPVGPVDFEIQTPGVILDSGQQETGNRLLFGVNCNVSGIPQILTPILIIDGVEYTLPKITSNSRVIIDMPIHGYHGRFWEGVRLTGRLTGRVEVFLIDISTKIGVPSPRGG